MEREVLNDRPCAEGFADGKEWVALGEDFSVLFVVNNVYAPGRQCNNEAWLMGFVTLPWSRNNQTRPDLS